MRTSPGMPRRGRITGRKAEPDFGTYHHSTPEQSSMTREKVRTMFAKAFDTLPFSRDDALEILDMGCGLGFLSCVSAEFYRNASVTGFDTFEHESLKDSSLRMARRNAEIRGLSERVHFQKGDVLRSDFKRFDLLVSSLVFHNLGKKRFDAYERLVRWTTPESYVILGDLFSSYEGDVESLSGLFGNVRQIRGSAPRPAYRVLVLSEPKKA